MRPFLGAELDGDLCAGAGRFSPAFQTQLAALTGMSLPSGRESTSPLGDATVLLLSGEPIDEPIVGHGPFVMNSQDEIRQAIADFNDGRFGRMPH